MEELLTNFGITGGGLIAMVIVLRTQFKAHEKRAKEKEVELETRLEKVNTARRVADDRLESDYKEREQKLHDRIEKTQRALEKTETKLEKRLDDGFKSLNDKFDDLNKWIINNSKK